MLEVDYFNIQSDGSIGGSGRLLQSNESYDSNNYFILCDEFVPEKKTKIRCRENTNYSGSDLLLVVNASDKTLSLERASSNANCFLVPSLHTIYPLNSSAYM